MHLHKLLDPDLLDQRIAEGYVTRRPHPEFPLHIYNYAARTQYDRAWDEVTTACRGLIVHADSREIVARPFSKFYNVGEHEPGSLPTRPPDVVVDKLDGSLGVIHRTFDGPAIATRGSFTSEQAQWATDWLRTNHPGWHPPLRATVLVEIIYPQNRIVVDYGDRAECVLLAVIENATGADLPLDVAQWPGAVADRFPGDDVDAVVARAEERDNTEGFVLVWHHEGAPSLRVKCKSTTYTELHRIVTGLSNRSVWEHLAAGHDFDALVATVPDEFHTWLARVAAGLRADVETITTTAERELAKALADAGGRDVERRVLAEHIKTTTHPGLCFALLDGKRIDAKVWRMVKPDRETPMLGLADAE